jgi:hypothetical protein
MRHGAFRYRVDENLQRPETFRTKMLVGSWAAHLRQHAHMTKAETEVAQRVWAMHAGDQEPVVRHYVPTNRLWTPLDFSHFQNNLAFTFRRQLDQTRRANQTGNNRKPRAVRPGLAEDFSAHGLVRAN